MSLFSQPGPEPDFYRVTDLPEGGETRFLAAFDRSGVGEAPMDALGRAGEDRAGFRGVVTDGDHVVKGLLAKLAQVLRAMRANIDPLLVHRLYCQGVDRGRPSTGAVDLELFPYKRT